MISISGCSDNPVEPKPIDTSKLMPLAINNKWEYLADYKNSSGSSDRTDLLRITIESDSLIDTLHWFRAYNPNTNLFYLNRSDGLWIKENLNEARLAFKYPGTSGTIYQSGNLSVNIQAENIKISVSAGEFNCYKYVTYTTSPTTDSIYYYFAPGYGMILRDLYQFENNLYHLKERWSLIGLRLH